MSLLLHVIMDKVGVIRFYEKKRNGLSKIMKFNYTYSHKIVKIHDTIKLSTISKRWPRISGVFILKFNFETISLLEIKLSSTLYWS